MKHFIYLKRYLALLIFAVGIVAIKSHAFEVESIEIIDLGVLPGDQRSVARDINDEGVIVGFSVNESGNKPFIYRSDTMRELPILSDSEGGGANAVNNHDQVVGYVMRDGYVHRGVIWESGRVRSLGVDSSLGDYSSARDINDDGLITGNIDIAAVVWRYSGAAGFPPFTQITSPYITEGPQAMNAHGINYWGQVVGTNDRSDSAFRWHPSAYDFLLSGSADDEYGYGINSDGKVVGAVTYPLEGSSTRRAALWPTPDELLDLGTLGGEASAAYDINDLDIVVGSSQTETNTTMAFVWHQEFGMVPLGTLGGANSGASAINTDGNIVGYSENAEGETRATLWLVTYGPRLITPWFFDNLDCFPFITCRYPYIWPMLIIAFALVPLAIFAWRKFK